MINSLGHLHPESATGPQTMFVFPVIRLFFCKVEWGLFSNLPEDHTLRVQVPNIYGLWHHKPYP